MYTRVYGVTRIREEHRKMSNSKAKHCALLMIAVALSRFLFRSRYLYDIDSVNFALALEHFDPLVHQPHPPGYYLYICLGRLSLSVFHDANTALVALSVLASAAAAAAIHALTHTWFGQKPALFAGLIFLFSPLSWFHGTVALTYILELFLAALVGYLCWQTHSRRKSFVILSAIALGVAAGVRQSSILFLGPLWLFSLRKLPRRQVLLGMAVLGVSLLAWLVPMTLESGGGQRYLASLYDLWIRVPGKRTVFASTPSRAFALTLARLITIAGNYGLCFGAAGLLPLLGGGAEAADRAHKAFIGAWIAPVLLFFTVVYLAFVNSGYLLVGSPPIFAWLGAQAASWHTRAKLSGRRKALVVGALAAVHAAAYLYAPFYCSAQAVKKFEAELEAVLPSVEGLANPNDTLIVGFDSHFLGYRHAGYYLPRYWTIQYPEVQMAPGKRVFAMKDRRTSLLSALPAGNLKSFVLFPLPDNSESRRHLEKVRAMCPPGTLSARAAPGREVQTGSRTDLICLFPSTAGLSWPGE